MRSAIKALTFDWYGTLATHRNKGRGALFSEYLLSQELQASPWDRRVLYEVFEYYARAYDWKSSEEEKKIFWTEFTRQLFDRFRVRGNTASCSDLHAPAIRRILGPDCFRLYPDVLPALSVLKRSGLLLGIVSNWHRGLDLFCREMDLMPLIDAVISSGDVGIEKPDTGIFHEAVRRLGLSPWEVVHIGDLPNDDYEGAVAAGLAAFLIDRSDSLKVYPNRVLNLLELTAIFVANSRNPNSDINLDIPRS